MSDQQLFATPFSKIYWRCAFNELKNTRMPIREIAGYVGFANEHYFSSSFKLHTGMTPGEYRKN